MQTMTYLWLWKAAPTLMVQSRWVFNLWSLTISALIGRKINTLLCHAANVAVRLKSKVVVVFVKAGDLRFAQKTKDFLVSW